MTKLISTSPDNTLGFVGEVEITTSEEVKAIVSKAQNRFKTWSRLTVGERKQYLEKVYKAFQDNLEDLAQIQSKEMGMIIQESRMDIESGLGYFRWFLDNTEKYLTTEVSFENETEIHTVSYEATGVAAVIMPWNYPFTFIPWGCIANLMVGNTVVFKHSEEVPVSCKMHEKLVNSAGLPEGVLNFIYGSGEVGEQLVHSDINLICFTGSTKTGRHLYQVAAEKMIKIVLEMGGSAPGVVFEDADLDNVVETVLANRFGNCGQICDGLKRIIIHESIADEFISKIKSKLESLKIGNPLEEDTNIGPLAAERQVVLLEEQVKDAVDKGAEVITGGERPKNLDGAYYFPTLLKNITRDMRVWNEEVFGPVLPIMTFKTYEEAIELANDTQYGLGGYVFTKNSELGEKVARDIVTGMVSINGAFYVIPENPFGGCKMSGLGREHSKWGLMELVEPKLIAKYK